LLGRFFHQKSSYFMVGRNSPHGLFWFALSFPRAAFYAHHFVFHRKPAVFSLLPLLSPRAPLPSRWSTVFVTKRFFSPPPFFLPPNRGLLVPNTQYSFAGTFFFFSVAPKLGSKSFPVFHSLPTADGGRNSTKLIFPFPPLTIFLTHAVQPNNSTLHLTVPPTKLGRICSLRTFYVGRPLHNNGFFPFPSLFLSPGYPPPNRFAKHRNGLLTTAVPAGLLVPPVVGFLSFALFFISYCTGLVFAVLLLHFLLFGPPPTLFLQPSTPLHLLFPFLFSVDT